MKDTKYPCFRYDEKYDILYFAFADKSNSECEENEDGLVFSLDKDTKELTGGMIYDFRDKIIEDWKSYCSANREN